MLLRELNNATDGTAIHTVYTGPIFTDTNGADFRAGVVLSHRAGIIVTNTQDPNFKVFPSNIKLR